MQQPRGHKPLPRVDDLFPRPAEVAALVLLQRSELAQAETSIFDVHLSQIMRECQFQLKPSSHNVLLQSGFKEQMRAWRTVHLWTEPGDVYLINTNRLHQVRIGGDRDRITLGTFLGVSLTEVRIWS